jgi:hypothetical protein
MVMFGPPSFFIPSIMKRPMMGRTKRNCPIVTYLPSHGSGLRVLNMMCLARLAGAGCYVAWRETRNDHKY